MCISPVFENREIPVSVEALPVRETLEQFFRNTERKDVRSQADALVIFLQEQQKELLENEVMQYINRFLMHRDDAGLPVFVRLYSRGHPVIAILKDKLGEKIWGKIISQDNGRYPLIVQAINHLFKAVAAESSKKIDSYKYYNQLNYLSMVNDKLKKLLFIQTALIKEKDVVAKRILAKLGKEHFILLTRLPALQKLCLKRVGESFSESIRKDVCNIEGYPIFFEDDKVQEWVIRAQFSPVSFLKKPNFNELFHVVSPVYFWRFAKSNNPIVHQVLGMVFDQLTYMQKHMYLKALAPTMFPFFVKSLRPENFAKVLKILPDNQLDFFNPFDCTVRFLLSEDEMTILGQAVHDKNSTLMIALALWVNPAVKELQRWIQVLEKVKEDKKQTVAFLKTDLEGKFDLYKNINKHQENFLIKIENLNVDYCQMSEGLPESPTSLSGQIFDKSSLMERRPLVNPVTAGGFSFFDLTYNGTAGWRNHYLRTRIFDRLRSLNPRMKLQKSQRIGCGWTIKE